MRNTNAIPNKKPKQIKLSLVDRFLKNYPKLLQFISELTLVIFSILKTLMTTVGVPIILVLLAIVEVNRVEAGNKTFEDKTTLALFGAWVLVLLNLVVEFKIHHVENTSNYVPDVPLQRSLRLFKQNIAYRLGVGKDWEARLANPANAFIRVQSLITFAIIALALSGSMKDEILAQGEIAWHVAFTNIMFSSSLNTMTTWVGGLLFTITAVYSAQIVARYIAIQALQAENDMRVVAKSISNREKGVVVITALQAAKRYKGVKPLRHLTEDDKLQVKPSYRFFDAEEDQWTKEYKSMQTVQKIMSVTNNRRKEKVAQNGR